MTQQNDASFIQVDLVAAAKRMFIGAALAFALILSLLLSVDEPKPEWGSLWMLKPLLITPLAGAGGGAFFYYMTQIVKNNVWAKLVATVVGLVGYVIAIWLGSVLGLNGTLWD
ncbi:hypothetical protein KACHI17_16330 [Sediminibacterium sp. KACHI17]|jgi:hypothetical protein|uniref:Potassium transporter KefB n=1 Tax=Sediminibacterium sp. KACHI17 TaxID=1751071 RepID=A0AAT9GJJ8_9BACT